MAACIIADIEALSISCAAQIVEIDSSKAVASSTSAGSRFIKSSTVGFWLKVGVDWMDADSAPGRGDP